MIGIRLPACLAVAGTVLALAGCGSAGAGGAARAGGAGSPVAPEPPPTTPKPQLAATALTADMKSAIRSASSVHISGQLMEGGKKVGLDVGVLRSGQLSGTITESGVPLEIIVIGGKAYVKATAAFLRELRAPAGVCGVICGKYVELPEAKTTELTRSLSLARLTRSLTGETPPFTNDGTASFGGQKAFVLRTAQGGIVDLAQAGRHYPLAVASPDGRPGGLTFSHWNGVPAPVPPPKGEIVNVGNLR